MEAAAAAARRDLQVLVERAGGRQRLRLAGEARAGELETFARELFAEPAPDAAEVLQAPEAAAAALSRPVARRVRVRQGCGRPWRGCALLFALFRVGSLLQPRWRQERRRLREILRDLRSQLPSAPLAAVVGVVVAAAAAAPSERGGEAAARSRLEALLRRVFRERRHPRPGLSDTLQVVCYLPGAAQGAAEAREAACRALRAALKLRADGVEATKQRLPPFLRCISWGRRNEHLNTEANKLNEDALQELEEAIALTSIAPNGNCEEALVGLDT